MIIDHPQRGRKIFTGFLLGSITTLLLACSNDNDPAVQYNPNSTLNPIGPTSPNNDSLAEIDPTNPSNWFNNGGAEKGSSPWYPQGTGVTVSQSNAQQHSGQYSMLVQGRSDVWHGPVMPVLNELPAGEDYNANIWVRLADGAAPATLQLSMKVAAQGAETHFLVIAQAEATANAWTRLSGTYSHRPEGEVSELTFYVQSPDTTVSFYVDDLTLEPQGNLIINAGIEAGTAPWRSQGTSAMLSQAAEQAHEGDYSLLVTGRADSWHAPVMDLPTLAGGQAYAASVWVRLAANTADTSLKLTLKRKASGTDEGAAEYIDLAQEVVTSDSWLNLSGVFTHTEAAVFDELFLFIQSDTEGAGASFYVDDLDVRITTLDYTVNGDVETGASGWYPFGANVTLTQTESDAYSGNYSLLVTGRDQNWQGASFGFASLTVGESYGFSCWVKMAPSNPESNLALMIKRADEESGPDGAYLQLNAAAVTEDDWVQLSGTYQHAVIGELLELTAYVNASIDTAEFLIDACAISLQ